METNGKSDPATNAPTTEAHLSSGVIVALFVVVLCCVIFLTCGAFWFVGKCRERQRGSAWKDVYDSFKAFPTKSTRLAKDSEDDTVWRGPAVFEVRIALPSLVEKEKDMDAAEDPSTIMDLRAPSPPPKPASTPKAPSYAVPDLYEFAREVESPKKSGYRKFRPKSPKTQDKEQEDVGKNFTGAGD